MTSADIGKQFQEYAKFLVDKYIEHDGEIDAISIKDAVDVAKIAQCLIAGRFEPERIVEAKELWDSLDTDPREDMLSTLDEDEIEALDELFGE